MKRSPFCLAIPLLFAFTIRCEAQVQPQVQPQVQKLGVEGTRRAQSLVTRNDGEEKPAGEWTIAPQRLTLATDSVVGATYSVRRDEPLPAGSWTMDVWLLQTGNWSSPESRLILGETRPEDNADKETETLRVDIDPDTQATKVTVDMSQTDGGLGDNSGAGAGPIQWLHLSWDEASQTVRGALNGKPMNGALVGKIPARTPFQIAVTYPNGQSSKRQFIVAGFRVRAGAEETTVSPLQIGAAWRGWSPDLPAPAADLPTGWRAALDRLSAPDRPARARAFALGAVLMLERSASDATWKRVSELVEQSTDLEADSLAQILPLAVASARTPAQREQALEWTQIFFDSLSSDRRNREAIRSLVRVALIDPQRSALALLKREMPYAAAGPLADDLKAVAPDLSFALWRDTNQDSPLAHAAWHLPQWQEFEPQYAALLVERLRALADEDGTFSHPDEVWSVAAYRLANTNVGAPNGADLALALEFAGKIKKDELRAQTLNYATRSLDWPGKMPRDEKLEAALVRAIALVKANSTGRFNAGSEAVQRVHLASYWRASGDADKAAAALRAIAADLEKPGAPRDPADEPDATAFRDWFLLAREGQRLDFAEAAAWWKRARAEAITPNLIGRGAIVLDGEPSFLSAQWLSGFARETNDLAAQWAQYLAFVLERDPARGAALWLKIDDESLRRDVLEILARGRSERGAQRAFALALPADKPGVAQLRAALAEPAIAATFQADLARWSGQTRAPAANFDEFDNAFATRLQGIAPQELLALEPAFGEQSALFARQMLGATATLTGLSNDPIWRRANFFDTRAGSGQPWRLDLQYAVRTDIKNNSDRKETNEIYRIFTP